MTAFERQSADAVTWVVRFREEPCIQHVIQSWWAVRSDALFGCPADPSEKWTLVIVLERPTTKQHMSAQIRRLLQRRGSAAALAEVMQFDVLHLEAWQRVTPRLYDLPLDEPIYWVTRRPDTLVVYRVAHNERKLQWLLHRAAACNVELRKVADDFPTFIAVLADLTPIEDDESVEPGAGFVGALDGTANAPERLVPASQDRCTLSES